MKPSLSDSVVKSSGVSLVEVMIILALVSALLAIVVPNFRGAAYDRELIDGAKTVQSAFMRTFAQTRSTGQSFGIILKDEGIGLELYRCARLIGGGCDVSTKESIGDGGIFGETYRLDIDSDFEVFFEPPHGDVSWSDPLPSTVDRLLTHQKSGKQKRITLYELSGLIEIITP